MGLKPVKVSQLNSYIKRILQTDPLLGRVSVIGEISNLKFHGSGHVYFSLKDENSKISCFLAAGNMDSLDFMPEEGAQVVAHGYIYLYERGGTYSLNIKNLELDGIGDLAAEFRKLKDRLEKEGLFDVKHKKALPFFPEKIAIVTSETGAAVRDILKIIKAKNTFVDIMIYPVLVQGPQAPSQIAHAIYDINESHKDIDIIITGRGGGSMEELMAFNDEDVARSIFASKIPVISAVGHETDFTIADFVADLRAETPTAAAHKAVPDTAELREHIDRLKYDITRNLRIMIQNKERQLALMEPSGLMRELQGRLAMEQMALDNIIFDTENRIASMITSLKHRLLVAQKSLESLNPHNILERGYCIVTDEKGKAVTDASALRKNQMINIRAGKGYAKAKVTDSGPTDEI